MHGWKQTQEEQGNVSYSKAFFVNTGRLTEELGTCVLFLRVLQIPYTAGTTPKIPDTADKMGMLLILPPVSGVLGSKSEIFDY